MSADQATVLPEGVKATSGGTFDRDDEFLYYIAGSPERVAGEHNYDKGDSLREDLPPLAQHPNVLVAVNEVKTKAQLDLLDRLCDTRRVLLDSGIFNLAMTHARKHEVSHDVGLSMPPEEIDGFGALWDRYGEIVTRFSDRLWGAIELDQGGVEHKPRTRARIEDEFGIVPMPVYHPLLDGWDYYDDLARNYDRICFGNLVKASPSVRLRLVHTASERGRGYPYLWTHLLGVYPNQNLLAMPLRGSCDSSSWLASERWHPDSWKGWSMMQMVRGNYPVEMKYAKGAHRRAAAVNALTAQATQITLGEIAQDTHPWLADPRRIDSAPVPPARPHAAPHPELIPDLDLDHGAETGADDE